MFHFGSLVVRRDWGRVTAVLPAGTDSNLLVGTWSMTGTALNLTKARRWHPDFVSWLLAAP